MDPWRFGEELLRGYLGWAINWQEGPEVGNAIMLLISNSSLDVNVGLGLMG